MDTTYDRVYTNIQLLNMGDNVKINNKKQLQLLLGSLFFYEVRHKQHCQLLIVMIEVRPHSLT
jgi:hypothetical protein